MVSISIEKRDFINSDGEYVVVYDPWWIWKWVIAALFLFFAFLIVVSYLHAHHRMKRGRAPMKYHRWMVRRQMRRQHPEAYNPNAVHVQMYPYQPDQHQQQYGQPQYAPPPPAYHPYGGTYGAPPTYAPGANGTKVDHTQASGGINPPQNNGEGSNPIRY